MSMFSSSELFPEFQWVVMGKAPEPGKVKTRMQPAISEQNSANLQAALSREVLRQWRDSQLCALQFWVGGDMDMFQQHVLDYSEPQPSLFEQVSGDLGERMCAAIEAAIAKGAKGVIVTGTDCPFMDTDYLTQALQALHNGKDVVLGPATDGGYVLIGMTQLHTELFQKISWGESSVFEQTCDRIAALKLDAEYLPVLSDIDYPEDLPKLAQCQTDDLQQFADLFSGDTC